MRGYYAILQHLHEAEGDLDAAVESVTEYTKQQAKCHDNLSLIVVVFNCAEE